MKHMGAPETIERLARECEQHKFEIERLKAENLALKKELETLRNERRNE